MCHPLQGCPLPSLESLSARARPWRRFHYRPSFNDVVNPTQTVMAGGAEGRKMCVCSPTRHPGSFRCRYHHAEYEWCRMKISS
ncbi:hypothetical protein RND81_08G056600 [Saponaria officinalis]|uniref:Uncharacterized protein n=1 Tax=Saponaria officinalis TaxID=3572 RepID=A0AAW1J468_SAPOF